MSVHSKFDPLRSLARVAKLRHMDMQCNPQCVLDLIAERDALAQRCRELEEDLAEQASLLEEARGQRDFLDRQQSDECSRREQTEQECDTLRAEVEQLRSDQALARQVVLGNRELRAEVDRLRNPSDDMLVAGQEVWARGRIGALEDCEEARAIYMAMIDAAMEAPR